MKRDPTVTISLIMIVGGLLGFLTVVAVTDAPSVVSVLFGIIYIIGLIRAIVLWFQTLIHVGNHAREENRVALVLAHLLLAPVMPYVYYYYESRKQYRPRAPGADVGPDSQVSPTPWTVPPAALSRALDAWFILFPVAAIAFYAHWFCSFGTSVVSPLSPAGHLGHVSWTMWWWLFAEMAVVALSWILSVVLICLLLARSPSIRRKDAWTIFAYLLAPIACPLCYFVLLRKGFNQPAGAPPPQSANMETEASARQKLRWHRPRFSLREILVVIGLLACLHGVVAYRAGAEELVGTAMGSVVLIWGLICWKVLRANRSFHSLDADEPAAANRPKSDCSADGMRERKP